MSPKVLPITVAVPVKNEEANLAKCLERLTCFAEVVVIDSGSTDQTVQIAQSYGARVEQFVWDGKYPKKRNWFLLHTPPKYPWVLFLDADEYIDDAFCEVVAKAVASEAHNGYWLTYTNYFLNKKLKFGVQQRKLALFRVGKGLYEKIDEQGWSQLDMEIHEHPIIEGSIGKITHPIDHRDYKGIAKFIARHNDYAMWEARRYEKILSNPNQSFNFTSRQRFKYNNIHRWWYSWFYFLFTYVIKLGFLDGAAGFHYSAYKAWYFRSIGLMIQESQRAKGT